MNNQQKIEEILIDKGRTLISKHPEAKEYCKNEEADKLMNDIENFPHAFVLGCVMDRQIKAERAWQIPYMISKEIGGFEFEKLLKLSKNQIKEIFNKKKLHRFNNDMAESFYLAIKKIHEVYNDDASNIWKDKQKSATIVRRFLEFKGVGIKIATMAANLLARDFKVPMADHICIDISPDTHIKRVFRRIGFTSKDSSVDEIIYKAKEVYPLYPGVLDNACFQIGRTWCKPKNPNCNACYLDKYCPKNP